MIDNRKDFSDILLNSYSQYYDIHHFPETERPLLARCDFHMEKGSYFLLKRNMTWMAKCHEYCYIVSVPHLTLDMYREYEKYVYDHGMTLIDPKSGDHMSTYLTLLVVCDSCDKDALRALKRCHIHKDFRFALDGWMDFHTALVCMSDHTIMTNMSGHDQKHFLKELIRLPADAAPSARAAKSSETTDSPIDDPATAGAAKAAV
ncbi:MAG: hypothetical protein SOI56_09755 [Eubacteriales bacterium]|jgi:hypothetical protein